MKIFKWLFSNKKKKENKVKEYEFTTIEAACVGNKYVYKVKAKSKKEAFKILVEYFYGKKSNIDNKVKSNHYTIHYPQHDKQIWYGMPYWFHNMIGGAHKTSSALKLKEYMIENNINLKE